jgi:phosphoserine aminotransferase
MLNTPPTMAIYGAGLVFKWALVQGGVAGLEAASRAKAAAVYEAMARRPDVYRAVVLTPERRSLTNLVWRLASEQEDLRFVQTAKAQGLVGLAGHRSVGGIRASVYNATSMAQVEQLVAFMDAFEAQAN